MEALSEEWGIRPCPGGRVVYAQPEHQFVVDEKAGIVAVLIPGVPGDPDVLTHSHDLSDLLHRIGAPAAEELS